MNQYEIEAKTSNKRQARQNAYEQVTIRLRKVARTLLSNQRAKQSKTKANTTLLSTLNWKLLYKQSGKTKTNYLLARVFPYLTSFTCICFEIWLVHCAVRVCRDWPEELLWFCLDVAWKNTRHIERVWEVRLKSWSSIVSRFYACCA